MTPSLSPWIPALGAALVHFVWQAALVGAALAAARPALRRLSPRARYAGNCLALFALPLVFASTLGMLHFSLASAEWTSTALGAGLAHWLGSRPGLLSGLVLAWAVGAVLCAGYSLMGWSLLQRTRRRVSAQVPEEWLRRLDALRQRMGVRVQARLGLSADVSGPCVAGWWRPLILLPLSALAALPPEQCEALLAHELAHILRRDYLVNLLQRAVEVMFFYHPAVWWISRQVSEEREHCCDDLAIAACGDRLLYARALVDLAERENAWRGIGAGIACAASGGSLSRRVRRIASAGAAGGEIAPRRWLAAVAMAGLALAGAVVAIAPAPQSQALHFAARANLPAPVRAVPASLRVPLRNSPLPVATAVPLPAPARQAQRRQPETPAARTRPPAAAPVVVAFRLASFSTACAPQQQRVRALLPDGEVWVGVRTVMQCEPVLQTVWVLTT